VDGLQYVHALLASIKLPSGLEGTSSNTQHTAGSMGAAAAAGVEGAAFQCSSGWEGGGEAARMLAISGMAISSAESEVLQQQQQQQQQGQEVCIAALEQLRAKGAAAAAASGAAGACLLEMSTEQQQPQQQQQPADLDLQLEDALTLQCLASDPQEQPSSAACSTSATAAKETLTARAEAKHAALHATLQRCLWAPCEAAGRTLQRQQRQQHRGRFQGVRLLCLRAIGAVVAERQAWCEQQLQHMWGCLKQVSATSSWHPLCTAHACFPARVLLLSQNIYIVRLAAL
jgi:hypothetical protein